MKIDLSLISLRVIRDAVTILEAQQQLSDGDYGSILEAIDHLEEMEGLDFDDCAGGACKL